MAAEPRAEAGPVMETESVSPAQTRAAHAYARTLLNPADAGPAAEDSLEAFRQSVRARGEAAGDPQSAAGNETLLALTRLMTAVSVPDRSSPEDRRQAVWASIGATSHCTCRESAALLATRANANIQPRESAALDAHLAGCAECRELAVKTVAAENAFRHALTAGRGAAGVSLPSVPRAVYALILALVVVGAGIFALGGGGSTPTASHSPGTVAQSQPIPTVTEAAAAVTPTTRHHSRAKPKAPAPKHKAAPTHKAAPRHKAAATHTTVSPAAPVNAPATTTADTGPASSDDTSAPTDDATGSATAGTSTPPATAPAASTPSRSSSSSAGSSAGGTSVVSSSSGLSADSAPQQGIGTLTTSSK